MGGYFTIMVKMIMAYYVWRLLKKIILGEDPDLTTVTNLMDVIEFGAVNITAESFAFFHVIKR
jgi:hypothetical protein